MISIGKHKARCTEASLGYSSKGTEQVYLLFVITDGEDSGRTISTYRFFSPNALKYTIADLRTLGWQGNDPSTIPENGFDTEVQIVVDSEVYNGQERRRIKFINPIGGGGMKNRMDVEQRKSFGQNMAKQIAALSSDSAGTFDEEKSDTSFDPEEFR